MSLISGGSRRLSALACAAFVTLSLAGTGEIAAAQGTEEEPPVRLLLTRQPAWHDDTGPLNIRLRLENDGAEVLEGFTLQLTLYERVTSRSALEDSFDGGFGPATAFPKDFARSIEPGKVGSVQLRQPVSKLFPLGTGEAGVYPLTIAALDPVSGETLDTEHTQLIYYPNEPEIRLLMVPVVPLNEVPARAPDGSFRENASTGGWPLETALATGGWLEGMVGAIADHAGDLRLGLAPTPRLVEEVADMADGYPRAASGAAAVEAAEGSEGARAAAAFLETLSDTLDAAGVQPLLVPYAFPDLPALVGELESSDRQISIGQQVMADHTDSLINTRWIFPPGGRLDAGTLDDLRISGIAERTFFSAVSLEGSSNPLVGCPEQSPSFTCPVRVTAEAEETLGYVSDERLQARLSMLERGSEKQIMLQRFFAESAMIREELPGVPDRIVQATIPAGWRPTPRLSKRLFRGLANAPWLRTLTPREGLQRTRPETRRIVSKLPEPTLQPDESYYAQIQDTQQEVEQFKSIGPPDDLLVRLRRNLLVAQSRSWWTDASRLEEGREYATRASEEVSAELDKIDMSGRDAITLTSREGPVSFVVSNDTGYKVTLDFRLTSQQLRFEDEAFTETIPPGNRIIQRQATAQSSGTFAMDALIETPDGSPVNEIRIYIRSTELNRVALGVTIAALLFVVIFYVLRGVQRRKGGTREQAAETTST